ncbi:MAG: putative Fe-S cluster assembly protein SufT [Verrucomicrobiota bacterium]
MSESDVIMLSRGVAALAIPSGEPMELPQGTEVMITQALGGTYTIAVKGQPGLFRIQNDDADALGKDATETAPPSPVETAAGGEVSEEEVWAQLKTCYDPEIPVNIVDLGLIYDLAMSDAPEGAKRVEVKMTLTAPGCGMGPTIAADAQQKILSLPGVAAADVELVWDPPWGPERISEEGKAKLGMA